MSLFVGLDEELVTLLAIIYRAVDWRKMRTNHRWANIFNHRVRAAATSGDIDAFVSRLCNKFGLQSLPADALASMEALRPRAEAALQELYEKHIPYCLLAIQRAKEMSHGRDED